ncbi:N-6 DNA methylase [Solwaraspora sp. WMMD791]|uniref:restriction endonuclease subunit M n=1 Tax=Solwaraspora sp. WMMD791 TaxID=3016086 RepID=UPI00249C9DCF|nr:N-6 DNA methylase [Solwaraspora sp. WMMD791]WFE30082.1 N-6 DNA methylase [Solwaraspora sp. WMMD791]
MAEHQKPEERVRQQVLRELKANGWPEGRLRWRPEWPVPKTPHDLTKRERNQRFDICGTTDLVAFADDSGEPHALQIIFEFKAPDIDAGTHQLIRYLSSEPMAKMGYWTNGSDSVAVYKSHTSDWVTRKSASLPRPGDDLTQPPSEPVTWASMKVPDEATLSSALRRLLATVVVSDSRATRSEDQLRELVHVLLVKLESDATASKSGNQKKSVAFQIYGDQHTKVHVTAEAIRRQFKDYFARQRTRIFHPDDRDEILLTDETIYAVVAELFPFRLLGDDVDMLSKSFQIFRTSALKLAGGQFLTPQRVIRPCVMAMEIRSEDKVIDPACGTGGFLVEALRQLRDAEFPDESDRWHLIKWANDSLYGVDMDHIGVKLTRAIMVAMGDGSTHVLLGDSIRRHQWRTNYPRLWQELGDPGTEEIAEQFTVVMTNPPFGEDLKVRAADARAAGFTIAKAAAHTNKAEYVDLEIGLLFLEQAYRLLQVGGRIGIILPETYFFSHKYRWLPGWLEGRLQLRGMLNIAMEAFEEFCRAKTNFYIFEKVGHGPNEIGIEA